MMGLKCNNWPVFPCDKPCHAGTRTMCHSWDLFLHLVPTNNAHLGARGFRSRLGGHSSPAWWSWCLTFQCCLLKMVTDPMSRSPLSLSVPCRTFGCRVSQSHLSTAVDFLVVDFRLGLFTQRLAVFLNFPCLTWVKTLCHLYPAHRLLKTSLEFCASVLLWVQSQNRVTPILNRQMNWLPFVPSLMITIKAWFLD